MRVKRIALRSLHKVGAWGGALGCRADVPAAMCFLVSHKKSNLFVGPKGIKAIAGTRRLEPFVESAAPQCSCLSHSDFSLPGGGNSDAIQSLGSLAPP